MKKQNMPFRGAVKETKNESNNNNAEILKELKRFDLEQQSKEQKELLTQNIPFGLKRKVEYKINKLNKLLEVL